MTTLSPVSFFIRDDLESFGYGEDGPLLGIVYYVIAQLADGTRYLHTHAFPAAEMGRDDDADFPYLVTVKDAKDRAERLMARASARGTINLNHWIETYPEYGSDAYQVGDALGEHLAWERQIEDESKHLLRWVA